MLVCGDDPPQQLGPLLCTKFAAERAAILKTIDAYSKRDDRNQSVIRTLRAMTSQPPAPNDDRSTRITNAARFSAANRSEVTDVRDGWPGSLRGRSSMYPWIAGGVAVVGAAAALLLSRSEPSKPPHLTMPAAPAAAPAPQTSISPATTPPPEPVQVPEQPTSPSLTPPQPSAAEVARDSSSLKSRESRARASSANADEEPLEAAPKRRGRSETEDDGTTPAHGSKPHSRDVLDDAPVTEGSTSPGVAKNPYRTPSQSPAPAQEASIAGAHAEAALRSSGATPGQDLRTLQRRPVRRIDVQDPFR
jgi:hypothetical protein